jgi:hypothetical protein
VIQLGGNSSILNGGVLLGGKVTSALRSDYNNQKGKLVSLHSNSAQEQLNMGGVQLEGKKAQGHQRLKGVGR